MPTIGEFKVLIRDKKQKETPEIKLLRELLSGKSAEQIVNDLEIELKEVKL